MGTSYPPKSKSKKEKIKAVEASGLVRLINTKVYVDVGYDTVTIDCTKSGHNDSNVVMMFSHADWDKIVKEVERGRKQFATRSK